MKKRLLCLLLCLVMVVGLMPITAFADSEEHECVLCGAIYYGDVEDDYFCNNCGYFCGPSAGTDCWFESHCWNCGACYLAVSDWCTECTYCIDCIKGNPETHCSECGECYLSEEDELCGECHRCLSCTDYICDDCGFCDDCSSDASDPLHCVVCDACFATTQMAEHDDAKHCIDCCSYCEQCGDWETCTANDTSIEYCDECGLCMECCYENRNAASGCEEYCIESSEYEYHYCEDCGECFCELEQCPYCGLCVDCCANNSDCSSGMCVEDGDYEDHFCPNCGGCTCEGWDEVCEFCGLCPDCCEGEIAGMRDPQCSVCDEYTCIEDSGFVDHMETAHSFSVPHTHRWKAAYSMDGSRHWFECYGCSEKKSSAAHNYNTDEICTVCGYKQGSTVYFYVQPSDVHVLVSDVNDYSSSGAYYNYGPTYPFEYRTTFRAKAFGSGVKYQWYCVYDDAGKTGKKLVDSGAKEEELHNWYVYGSTTPTLTVSVDAESCARDIYYYCVATDSDGNTARSTAAQLDGICRYSYARSEKITNGRTIYQKDTRSGAAADPRGYYQTYIKLSEGHRWYCCGEGHDNYPTRDKVVSKHNYSDTPSRTVQAAYTERAAANGEFLTFNVYKCNDCGFEKYVEKHEHKMIMAAPTEVDESLFTRASHPLICEVDGCDKTGKAAHDWFFNIVQWPSSTANGGVERVCNCGFTDCDFYWSAKDVASGKTTNKYWDRSNMLVQVNGGDTSRTMAEPGSTIVLTPKKDGVHAFTGWTVEYSYYKDGGYDKITKTFRLTCTKQADGTYTCTIPTDFFTTQDVLGGGLLTFTGNSAERNCPHRSGTIKTGAKAPVCTRDGYTGDVVCKDCGKIVTPGEVIPGAETHSGELTLIPGTAVAASCTNRGYEGDFKCSDCGGTVAGKRSAYEHNNKTTVDYVAPTCSGDGYSGDIVCNDCGKVLSNGKTIPPLDHFWDDGVISTERRGAKTFNVITNTCTRDGCGETKKTVLQGILEDGTSTAITSANLSMLGFSTGNTVGNLSVASGSMKFSTPSYMVYNKNPYQNGVLNLSPLSDTHKFTAGGTYYLVVYVDPADGFDFADRVSVKLNGDIAGILVKNVKVSVPGSHDSVGTDKSVAIFNLTAPKVTPTGTYSVSVTGSMAGITGSGNYSVGDTVTVNAGTKPGYTFAGWLGSNGVEFADASSETTTFTMPAKSVNVNASWKKSAIPVTYAGYSLSGYEVGKKVVDVKLSLNLSTEGIEIPDSYGAGYAIYASDPLKTGKFNEDMFTLSSPQSFTAQRTYYLLIHLVAKDGYSIEKTDKANITVDGVQAANFMHTGSGSAYASFELPTPGAPSADHVHEFDKHFAMPSTVKTPATCTTAGVYYVSCICGEKGTETFTTYTSPNNHSGSVGTEWKCDGSTHWKEYSCCSAKANEASHNYGEWTTVTPAKVNVEGLKERVCADCGYKQTEKIPALNPTVSFPDVKPGAYYYEAVQWAAGNGITNGSDGGKFDPDGNCTRAQIVTFLWRANGSPKVSAEVNFTDVKPGAYYYDAVKWAVANNITNGIGGGLFDPDGECSRSQIVTFLWRANGKPIVSSATTFPDVQPGAYYYDAVRWAVANGITNGSDGGKFDTEGTCTRAQAVTFLYRTYGK